jgi:hypothetical protein
MVRAQHVRKSYVGVVGCLVWFPRRFNFSREIAQMVWDIIGQLGLLDLPPNVKRMLPCSRPAMGDEAVGRVPPKTLPHRVRRCSAAGGENTSRAAVTEWPPSVPTSRAHGRGAVASGNSTPYCAAPGRHNRGGSAPFISGDSAESNLQPQLPRLAWCD